MDIMGNRACGPDKEAYIESLFSSIAGKYDLLNTVMSLTRHRAWRRFAVAKADLKPGDAALDVCCGTGDFSFELARAVGTDGRVVGVDFSLPMIELAKKKARHYGYEAIDFLTANARKLPFADCSFDCVTVGFGLRNLSDVRDGLREIARVLRPGGRLVCLEISKVRSPILAIPWKLYFYKLTPYTATLFRTRRLAYEYLPESVKNFMSREELAAEFSACGFEKVEYFDKMFGAVCVHVGTKLS